MANLPYVTTVGTLTKMLEKVKKASVPDTFSQEFVEKTLLMKGGTAKATMPFLKKMGLVAQDGSPTDLYRQFRNEARSGAVIATCMRDLYSELFAIDENVYKASDEELKGLIVEVTGSAKTAQVTKMTFSTFRALNKLAEFAEIAELEEIGPDPAVSDQPTVLHVEQKTSNSGEALNLSYTINLNLPSTSGPEVFNAIFNALKKHLLRP